MNLKENWLRTIKNDNPEWIPLPWEPFKGFIMGAFIPDPIFASIRPMNPPLDVPWADAWGTYWMLQTGSIAPTPWINDENKVIKDITEWRKYVKFPQLDGYDWRPLQGMVASVNRDEKMVCSFVAQGLFEMTHMLMGFEDALCNYMLEPEAMGELLDALTEWKIAHLTRIMENLKPDVVHYHDDWGSKDRLFLDPEVWREMIKPRHKRIVDCVKSYGAIFMHHADCICEPIVEDMAEIGIDIWQGVIPQNNILDIQKRLKGSMAMMGGIDAQLIDFPQADEALIRHEVRQCIDTYCPQGCFFPCIPNIVPIFPEVERIMNDEMQTYGRAFLKK